MRIFVLTGAGLSAESGIRTFRAHPGQAEPDALWAEHDPMRLATPGAFAADPALVHRFYSHRRAAVQAAVPNAAHAALARLQRELRARGGNAVLCTQNVDDLLERAPLQDGDATEVVHMHGSLLQGRCLRCGAVSPWREPMDVESACPRCGTTGAMRPNVVWFGEMPLHVAEIEDAIADAELFVAIGTSGSVYPAAGFVDLARELGKRTLELNLHPSDRAGAFDAVRLGPATETVPAWVAEVLAS